MSATLESISGRLLELVSGSLPVEELELLYSFKFGSSLQQALQQVGCNDINDFLCAEKGFMVQHGTVSLMRTESVVQNIEAILIAHGGKMPLTQLCGQYILKFNDSLSSVVGMRPAEFLQTCEHFLLPGRGLVCLRDKKRRHKGAPRVAALSFMKDQDEEAYIELDAAITKRSLAARAARALDAVAKVIEESYLNVSHVIRGGAVGKGLTTTWSESAELVVLVEGVPAQQPWLWVVSLLQCALSLFEQSDMQASRQGKSLIVTYDSFSVCIRFAPSVGSFEDVLICLDACGGHTDFDLCCRQQQIQFVSRQSRAVKRSIRLLQWWREQQEWSDGCRPCDEVLELICIFVHHTTCPVDQSSAVAGCMNVMSNFNVCKVVWTNFYKKLMVPATVLQQRPLLLDVANPHYNRARDFNYHQMMEKAARTHFFW